MSMQPTAELSSVTPEEFSHHWSLLRRRHSLRSAGMAIAILALVGVAGHVGEVDLGRLWANLPRLGNYVGDTLPSLHWQTLAADLSEWFWGWRRWLRLIVDTAVIAALGTVFGGVLALAGSLVAARNLAPRWWLGSLFRRLHEVARTVPKIVYALIFVYAFGIGPFAGMLAILVNTWGSLGKLTAEANENIDMRPVEGACASGNTWPSIMRFAVLPQIMPNFLSYMLFRFEINVRAASVLGIVGAGGIGQELYLVIRQFEYTDISAIIVMIVATVALIDIVSETLRHRLIGFQREARA